MFPYLKAFITYRWMFFLICTIAVLLCSCSDESKQTRNSLKKRYVVDLFPEELTQKDGKVVRQMTYKEAVAKSTLTLCVPEIILVDKSEGRGNKPLYLYKVQSRKVIKPAKGYRKKYPVYFIANKELSVAQGKKEEVFVFLENIRNHKLLTKQRNMKYQWLNDAPVLSP